MKLILQVMKSRKGRIFFGLTLKMLAALGELMIPYGMECMIDDIAPTGKREMVFLLGCGMLLLAIMVRMLNVTANRNGVRIAAECARQVRGDLFRCTLHLSGAQTDAIGLPSLISRMTSDSYNVQSFIQSIQAVGIRAPVLLIGGMCVTIAMDIRLASILMVLAPLLLVLVVLISLRGVPMYTKVQQRMDDLVRILRENITGVRVVRALSKEEFETNRYAAANEAMTRQDRRAGVVMAMPGPIMSLILNIGLTLVVYLGARYVNEGLTQPGVILAFLTYFNMILMGVMGITRVFLLFSKANASANRMKEVLDMPEDLVRLDECSASSTERKGSIVFDHVSFRYGEGESSEERRYALRDIDFSIKAGGSLGVIGATGSGKTTLIRLLMRFYDPTEGSIFVDGKDIRTFEIDDLRRRFGVVFQNDVIFADTLEENIVFGRDIPEADMEAAARDACAMEFISGYPDRFAHEAAIQGADLSGGQRQRVLLSRAMAGSPEILLLDDASSALDYRTDASLRAAIREHRSDCVSIIIAQRVSSIRSLDHILYLEDGRIAGYGTHEELMASCAAYREIAEAQMGEGK